ncbi:MAG TPA: extracellular solute-binding protein, partial [bacterium]|nr:extracellular solute-binding protein [bacterium]
LRARGAALHRSFKDMGRTLAAWAALWALGLAWTASVMAAPMAPWERELYQAAKKEGEVTWYTAHYPTDIAAALCKGFETTYPGIKCNFVRTTAQVAYQRLTQDEQAGQHICTVFSSTDLSHYPKLKQDGLLLPYRPHNLDNMVDSLRQYNDPGNYFVVTSAGLVLIAYNTSLLPADQAPKKWTDLLDPRWKGKIAIGHPGFSGYVGTWVVLMRKMYGWDYFVQLEKNKPRIGRSINDTVTLLNAREVEVGASPDATTLISRDRGNPLAVVYPEDGTLVMIAPTGLIKDGPSPHAGELFEEYLLSKDAAEIQVKLRSQVVIKGVSVLPGAKSLGEVKTARPTLEEIDKGIPEVIEQFRDTFGI